MNIKSALAWGFLGASLSIAAASYAGLKAVTSSGGGGGGTPGGSNTQVQYNNSGAFGGITGATTDGTNLSVTTQTSTDNTTKAASTAFVTTAISNATGSATVVTPAHGGTGVANNSANTITFTGAFSLGVTLSGNTNLTFPTSGTVLTTANTTANITGSSTINPGAVASGACSSAVTTTATGVSAGWKIAYDFGDLSATTGYSGVGGLLTIYKYTSSNAVNWKVCNWTAASITPSSITVNWTAMQ